jgi:anti-sigma factor RsiW
MTPPEIGEDELQAFVDGKLAEGRCTAVLAHLGRHPEEVQRLTRYALHKDQLRRGLQALEQPAADPATAQLLRMLAERLTRPDYGRWLRQAAGVALLLAVGWSSHVLYQTHLEPHLPSVVIEAAQAHEVFGDDSQRPVELTAASGTEMAAWFSRHLGEPVEIPSLRALGLRLIGGRLLTGDEGPVAQLIYEDNAGRRLTLCLSSEPAVGGLEIELVEVDGLTAGYWQDGELSYALVAQTPDLQLLAIASELGAEAPDDLL